MPTLLEVLEKNLFEFFLYDLRQFFADKHIQFEQSCLISYAWEEQGSLEQAQLQQL